MARAACGVGGAGTWAWFGSWLFLSACAAPGSVEESESAPLELEVHALVDALSNVSGGLRRTTEFPSSLDVTLTADMEALADWGGGTLFLYGLANAGGSISAAAGDLQALSNIEAPETVKLFEAWYEQRLSERATLLGGLFDVNSEFDVMPAAGLFVHSAHGMGSDFGSSGLNGPSTFPASSVAVRLDVTPADNLYVRAVVADGVPGDPNDPDGTQVRFDSGDGILWAAEVGWLERPEEELRRRELLMEQVPADEHRRGGLSKTAIGVWGYTTEFTDFFRVDSGGQPQTFDGTTGVYVLTEQRPFSEAHDPYQGLSVFARAGAADERANLFDGYLGAGLVYRGPIPGRDDDRLGFAVAAAHLSSDFRTASSLAGNDLESWEVALELTYRAVLAPWLSIQPDVHYVLQPGGDDDVGDSLVVGARLVVSL